MISTQSPRCYIPPLLVGASNDPSGYREVPFNNSHEGVLVVAPARNEVPILVALA